MWMLHRVGREIVRSIGSKIFGRLRPVLQCEGRCPGRVKRGEWGDAIDRLFGRDGLEED